MDIPTVRESFSLPFRGGAIWCEQMDCLGADTALIRDKFRTDMQRILRPSTSSRIMLALHETSLDPESAKNMVEQLLSPATRIQMLAVVGADRTAEKLIKTEVKRHPPKCAIRFFDDYEPAKEWLIP